MANMRKRSELLTTTATSTVCPTGDSNAVVAIDRDELWASSEVCDFFGGIHPSTLRRGVAEGRFPRPVKVGPQTNRWLRSECVAARSDMIASRGSVTATALA
jgi:predicted DNA-binding transcriptional regulator AlpA